MITRRYTLRKDTSSKKEILSNGLEFKCKNILWKGISEQTLQLLDKYFFMIGKDSQFSIPTIKSHNFRFDLNLSSLIGPR